MEEFELVDESGAVIGRAPRSACHGDPSLMHRAVHVFVTDQEGRVLLQKRSADKDIQPGKWDTSVGGHLDMGEGYEQAALREVAEELGIRITADDLVYLHDYRWLTDVECELVRTYLLVHEGPFTIQESELDEVRFFSRDELDELVGTGELTPNLEHEIERLRE